MKSANCHLVLGTAVLLGALTWSCASGPTARDSTESSPGGAMGMTSRDSSPKVEELDRFVLIIKESPSGQVTHRWQPVAEVDLSRFKLQPRAQSTCGHIVLAAARQRDCHEEFNECIDSCVDRPLSEDYAHMSPGAKRKYCREKCWQPYRDCEELQKHHPQELSATDQAVVWLKRNRTKVLVGSIVMVAGVAFIVAFPPAGAIIALVPVAAVAASEVVCEPHNAATAVVVP